MSERESLDINNITAITLEKSQLIRVLWVEPGLKQTALITENQFENQQFHCLYRPEKGVRLTIDPRIPKPEELYRDVAYHQIDNLLGWNITAPVAPWSLKEGDRGVIRPYWLEISNLHSFSFTLPKLSYNIQFWLHTAVLDYVCGVVDRTPNDILVLPNDKKILVDSGLSFVDGTKYTAQNSIVRQAILGVKLPPDIINDLQKLNPRNIQDATDNYLDKDTIKWVIKRSEKIASKKVVI